MSSCLTWRETPVRVSLAVSFVCLAPNLSFLGPRDLLSIVRISISNKPALSVRSCCNRRRAEMSKEGAKNFSERPTSIDIDVSRNFFGFTSIEEFAIFFSMQRFCLDTLVETHIGATISSVRDRRRSPTTLSHAPKQTLAADMKSRGVTQLCHTDERTHKLKRGNNVK